LRNCKNLIMLWKIKFEMGTGGNKKIVARLILRVVPMTVLNGKPMPFMTTRFVE